MNQNSMASIPQQLKKSGRNDDKESNVDEFESRYGSFDYDLVDSEDDDDKMQRLCNRYNEKMKRYEDHKLKVPQGKEASPSFQYLYCNSSQDNI
jgi:hypothetical protein